MTKELKAFRKICKNLNSYVFTVDYIENKILIEIALKENKKLKKLYKAELNNTAYYNNLALKYKKALELIKENLVVSYDESENDKPCLVLSIKVGKDNLVVIYETFDKEKIDLLKEVLL